MKKFLKIIAILLFVFSTGCGVLFYIFSDPMPQSKDHQKAELLIDRMWHVLQADAWFAAEAVQWSFRGKHHYVWHKGYGRVRLEFDTYRVYFHPHQGTGIAFENDQQLPLEQQKKLVTQAIQYFNNDSFWLLAPFKARDQGTTRSYVPKVKDENGEDTQGVLVHYQSGGSTPGDRYLWLFDQEGKPKSWKLWVQIIPVKGVRFTWENWHTTESGARISLLHKSAILDVPLDHVRIVKKYDTLKIKDALLTTQSWTDSSLK